MQEAIDFLEFFNRMNDINIIRAKLQLWLKISILIKKDAILAYPMLIERILKHLDSLNGIYCYIIKNSKIKFRHS